MPPWYVLISAARYLGVPPWELRSRSSRYVHYAYMASKSERMAEETKAELARIQHKVG